MLLIFGGIQAAVALVFTDNLSTAIIIAGISVSLVFMIYPRKKPFIIGGVTIAVLGTAVLTYLNFFVDGSENFRIRRVLAWLRPEENLLPAAIRFCSRCMRLVPAASLARVWETARRSWGRSRRRRMI